MTSLTDTERETVRATLLNWCADDADDAEAFAVVAEIKAAAVAAALAPIEALVTSWEREADAIAITYQDPDARYDATVGHRAAIAAVRAALAGGGDRG